MERQIIDLRPTEEETCCRECLQAYDFLVVSDKFEMLWISSVLKDIGYLEMKTVDPLTKKYLSRIFMVIDDIFEKYFSTLWTLKK